MTLYSYTMCKGYKQYCYPGANIDDITEEFDDFTGDASPETIYIALVGANNTTGGRTDGIR